MSKSNNPYFKGAFWLGLAFLIPSGIMLYVALSADTTTLEGPQWVSVAFVLMFVSAGVTIMLLDAVFNRFRETIWFSYFHLGTLLLIPLILTVLLNWVAFWPGEREFSGAISIPFFSLFSNRIGSTLGRVVFAIPALLMDGFVVIVIGAVIRNMMGSGQE